MKKTLIGLSILLLAGQANAKPPKVSGNYEQGSRYAIDYDEEDIVSSLFEDINEELDQETWAYDYTKAYLQLSQEIKKGLKYTLKYDYLDKDFFAATTNNKNRINNYRIYSWMDLPQNFRLKAEYYLKHQDYTYRDWDNMTHVPHMLLQWKPVKGRIADLSIRYRTQKYSEDTEAEKDKNQVSTYLGYKEKLNDNLTLKAKYKYTFRKYTDNPTETNAVRKSFSAGFDYQF